MKRILGFTLVELLIVMAILTSLVGLVAGGFRSSQMRGRDAQRKSDLKQIANALELLTSDYAKYPDDAAGVIKACPFDGTGATSANCAWGTGSINDGKTVYLKKLPQDPGSGLSYFYRLVPSSSNQKYQLFARLENSKDADCIEGNCVNPTAHNCGNQLCNYAVTSSNTDYSE